MKPACVVVFLGLLGQTGGCGMEKPKYEVWQFIGPNGESSTVKFSLLGIRSTLTSKSTWSKFR